MEIIDGQRVWASYSEQKAFETLIARTERLRDSVRAIGTKTDNPRREVRG